MSVPDGIILGGMSGAAVELLDNLRLQAVTMDDGDLLSELDRALRDILEGSVRDRVGARLAVFYLYALQRGLVGPGADDTPLVWEDASGATRFLYRDCL